MSWKDTLLDASFRGVKFEVMNVSRAVERAIVANEYPNVAGAELDDQNLKGRTFNLKAIIYGDNYEDDLKQLTDALDAPGVAELVHPIHGAVQAMSKSWSDEHDADLVDGCLVNMLFWEHTPREPVFTASSVSAKADDMAAKAASARSSADDALVRRLEGAQNSSLMRLAALKDGLAQAKGQLSKLLNTTALQTVLSDLDPVLYPRAYVTDLLSVVDRALQGLPFGLRNILFDSNSGASAVSGSGLGDFNIAAKQLDPASVTVQSSFVAPDADVRADTAIVRAHARVHAACALADSAVIVLAGEMETPLLDRADIEAIANKVRTGIQVAIDDVRTALDAEGRGQVSTTLRALAFSVQEAALVVINQRPPLVRRASPLGGPVRLVAHQIYGDAARAPEITRLNSLGRKVFVDRGDQLNVYST